MTAIKTRLQRLEEAQKAASRAAIDDFLAWQERCVSDDDLISYLLWSASLHDTPFDQKFMAEHGPFVEWRDRVGAERLSFLVPIDLVARLCETRQAFDDFRHQRRLYVALLRYNLLIALQRESDGPAFQSVKAWCASNLDPAYASVFLWLWFHDLRWEAIGPDMPKDITRWDLDQVQRALVMPSDDERRAAFDQPFTPDDLVLALADEWQIDMSAATATGGANWRGQHQH